jgi:hypothetical protein
MKKKIELRIRRDQSILGTSERTPRHTCPERVNEKCLLLMMLSSQFCTAFLLVNFLSMIIDDNLLTWKQNKILRERFGIWGNTYEEIEEKDPGNCGFRDLLIQLCQNPKKRERIKNWAVVFISNIRKFV